MTPDQLEALQGKPFTFADFDHLVTSIVVAATCGVLVYKRIGFRATRRLMWFAWAVGLGVQFIPHLLSVMYWAAFGGAFGIYTQWSMRRAEFKFMIDRMNHWYQREFGGGHSA